MPASVLSAFLVFTFITAFTPGPNNILALNSGTRLGFQGSAPVLAGICSGFFCVMCLCGVLVFSLSTLSEQFMTILRCIGCLYIVWLAWKIAMANPREAPGAAAGAGFMTGFLLQFVNAKIMVYATTAYSGFILPWHHSIPGLLVGMCVLTLIGSVGTLAWALAGSAMQRVLRRHARLANAVMALLLLGCAFSLLR